MTGLNSGVKRYIQDPTNMLVSKGCSLHTQILHRKTSFSIFPSQAGRSLTKLSLGGNYDGKYKLILPRESLVITIPAGDGNIGKLFLRCRDVLLLLYLQSTIRAPNNPTEKKRLYSSIFLNYRISKKILYKKQKLKEYNRTTEAVFM
jgi:hypothetical protein